MSSRATSSPHHDATHHAKDAKIEKMQAVLQASAAERLDKHPQSVMSVPTTEANPWYVDPETTAPSECWKCTPSKYASHTSSNVRFYGWASPSINRKRHFSPLASHATLATGHTVSIIARGTCDVHNPTSRADAYCVGALFEFAPRDMN
jgi:hypothetical protein